jgi:hypothetical protein
MRDKTVRNWGLKRRLAAAVAGLAVSGGIAFASCGGTEPLVVAEAGTLVSTILQNMLSGALSIITQSVLSTDRTISALKVAVKQEAASSEKKIAAMRQASEGFATTYVAARTNAQVTDVYNTYRSQGFDPCGNGTATELMRQQEQVADAATVARVAVEVDKAPGRFGDPVMTQKTRIDEHNQLFCTQAEKDAGICSNVTALAGADSSAGVLFKDSAPGDDTTKAKNAFINNIFGLPDSANAYTGKGDAPEAQSALHDKHRRDVLNSVAMVSFKAIQSEHEMDSSGKSLATRIRERVETYFGSAQSENWAKLLATQEQHGILIDMMKMDGLELKLVQRRIKQNMRMEGSLAGLLALANDRTNGK